MSAPPMHHPITLPDETPTHIREHIHLQPNHRLITKST